MKVKSRCVCLIWSPNSIMGLSVHDSSYFPFFMILCGSKLIKNSWNAWFIAVSCVLISFSNFWCECIAKERGKFNDHKIIFKQRQCYVYDWKIIIIILFDRHRNNIVWTRNTCCLLKYFYLAWPKYELRNASTVANDNIQIGPKTQIEKKAKK